MADISFTHAVLFFTVVAFNIVSLFLALKAKKMITGYRAEFVKMVIGSFLIFSAAILFHALREFALDIPGLVLIEHSFVLLSLLSLLCTGISGMRNRSEWGL